MSYEQVKDTLDSIADQTVEMDNVNSPTLIIV